MTPEQVLITFELELCEKYDVYPFDGCSGTAPTGESYITYSYYDSYTTPLDAVEQYIKRIKENLLEPRPRLFIYWRTRPEIMENEGQYKVWSRFLISDKDFFMPEFK